MYVFAYKDNKDCRDISQSERSNSILSDGLQRKREANRGGREGNEKEKYSAVKKKTKSKI